MARVDHQLAHLIHVDAEAARDQILEALRAEKMHMSKTAARIGCTHGTLLNWIKKLDSIKGVKIAEAIASLKAVAENEGWHWVNTGNPNSRGRPPLSAAEKKRRAEARAVAAQAPAKRAARSKPA